MIGKILSGIMSLVIGLVSLILAPIDALITQYLPALETAFTALGNFFSYLTSVIGYAVDFSCLSDVSIALIVSYWTFVLMATPLTSLFKAALAWYNKLKP